MALYYKKNFFEMYNKKYSSLSKDDIKTIKQYLPTIPDNGLFLDLACGSGALGESLLNDRPNLRIIGADLCFPLLKWAEFPTCQSDASNLPFNDSTFDGILAAAAFHHFSDVDAVIKECFRCLKPGGFLFAYDPNKFHPQRFIMMTDPLRHIFYRNGDHALSPIVFKRKFAKYGFHKVSVNFLTFGTEGGKTLSALNRKLIVFCDDFLPVWTHPFTFPWYAITGFKH